MIIINYYNQMIYIYIYIYIYICVCVCVCVFVIYPRYNHNINTFSIYTIDYAVDYEYVRFVLYPIIFQFEINIFI